ncbi:MAG: hypothetical protein BJ554DRAFT_1103 [Olpidium bornovanus]|uniref:Uncharacterized protein n=1 Tax=Olpidium bornovanus TaxID=278681 RepID=A0A8H7ZSF9_9FUNG|nr:MAG: hypothetical protein BJ554DRAFT_1103 [Olpidium bornovanus]
MVYRYRAYVPPGARRQMMGHRQVINASAAKRPQKRTPDNFRDALDGDDDRSFNDDEDRYADGSRANDPPREGRWFWMHRDIGQFNEDGPVGVLSGTPADGQQMDVG